MIPKRQVMLHKAQLRPLHGALTPALIGIHSNIDGIQLTYDVPHHSFWIQASPDMPDVLKRRCLDAYHQLHAQGVVHGNVDFANILIGGDGNVKLINFEKSRSTKGDPRVQLDFAASQDFKMEMREVHYKLDYSGAREKEHMAWENRHNPRQNQPHRRTRGKTLYDKPPYTISLDPPVDPTRWTIPENWGPKRFVVPGQSVEQFEYHLSQFLLDLEKPVTRGRAKRDASLGPNLPLPDPLVASTSQEATNFKKESPVEEGPARRYNLRKRRLDEIGSDSGGDDDNPSTKRVRFLALTNHDDGTRGEVRSPPPPGVKRQVPRIRQYRDISESLTIFTILLVLTLDISGSF